LSRLFKGVIYVFHEIRKKASAHLQPKPG